MATRPYRQASQALFGAPSTPQTQRARVDQTKNDNSGYVWAISVWDRVDRFLFIGSESGTAYTQEQPLTVESAKAVLDCIKQDGPRLVARLVEVSTSGAARKNAPSIFALALAAAKGDASTKTAAMAALPRVARTASDMLQFVQFVDDIRGWGRGLRRGIARWYNDRSVSSLAYQVTKYRERAGWNHRDVLRMAHAAPGLDEARQILYRYLVKGWDAVGETPHEMESLRQVWAYERLQVVGTQARPDIEQVTSLIRAYRLPWEAVPTTLLKNMDVQDALLESMPVGAMLRQLGRMTANGFLAQGERARLEKVTSVLTNTERLTKGKIHPFGVLAAAKTYAQGHGVRGSLKWTPVPKILDALDEAFYAAFGAIEPINQRVMYGLDISGSMSGTLVHGIPGLTAKEAVGALALAAARTEPDLHLMAFNTSAYAVTISGRQRLDDVVKTIGAMISGGTNCAIPIMKAIEQRTPVDLFVILTDSQTWQGNPHPQQALDQYRQAMGIPAKLATVAMATNNFTLSDPTDRGMMHFIGMDTNLPSLLRTFAHGFAIPSRDAAMDLSSGRFADEEEQELVEMGA